MSKSTNSFTNEASKKSVKTSLRIFIFCTLGTNGLIGGTYNLYTYKNIYKHHAWPVEWAVAPCVFATGQILISHFHLRAQVGTFCCSGLECIYSIGGENTFYCLRRRRQEESLGGHLSRGEWIWVSLSQALPPPPLPFYLHRHPPTHRPTQTHTHTHTPQHADIPAWHLWLSC